MEVEEMRILGSERWNCGDGGAGGFMQQQIRWSKVVWWFKRVVGWTVWWFMEVRNGSGGVGGDGP